MMNRTTTHFQVVLNLLLAFLAGSVNDPHAFGPLTAEQTLEIVPYLKDGLTTRAKCIARFGNCPSVYDGGNNFIYSDVNFDAAIGFSNLILCFDAQGVLSRHAIVRNPPDLYHPDT